MILIYSKLDKCIYITWKWILDFGALRIMFCQFKKTLIVIEPLKNHFIYHVSANILLNGRAEGIK